MTHSEAKCYRTLGLTTAASIDDIKRAYRRIARKLHPDRVPDKEEQFKVITAAYNALVVRHGRGQKGGRAQRSGEQRPGHTHRSEGRSRRSAEGPHWSPWTPGSASQTRTPGGESGAHGERQNAPGRARTGGKAGPSHRWPRREQAQTKRQRRARAEGTTGNASSRRTPAEAETPGQPRAGASQKRRRAQEKPSPDTHRTRSQRATTDGPKASASARRQTRSSTKPPSAHRSAKSTPPAGASAHRRSQSGRAAAADSTREHLGPERAPTHSTPPEDFNAAWRAWCEGADRYHTDRKVKPTDEPRPVLEPQRENPPEAGAGKKLVDWVRRGLRRAHSAGPQAGGEDVVLRLPVSVDQLFHGGTIRIAALRPVTCPSCHGAGDASCVCDGQGRIRIRDEVPVTVPPGARTGVKLRVTGKGADGLRGAHNGDLILRLEAPELPGFRREGLNLHGTVYVSQRMARVGGTVQLELPRGSVNVKVPLQSANGDRFRLRNQGVPVWGGGEQGDMILSVVVR